MLKREDKIVSTISIITLIGANNIGAYLQAYILGKCIKYYGFNVEYLSMPSRAENLNKAEKIFKYVKSKNIGALIFKTKSGRVYSKARELLNVVPYQATKKYNIVIIGSDEMWNLTSDSFHHFPEYFGMGIHADLIASYAPSVGNSTFNDLKNSDFSVFNKISVRDQRTYDLVKQISGREAVKVLDPTFLLKPSDFASEIRVRENFIMVYSYGITEKEIDMAKEFAELVKLPLYSIGTYNSWCDKNIVASPFEFLGYLKKAKYVIAATFHGIALSINFNKQFVACVKNSEKIQSLLIDFGLEDRIVTEQKSISQLFDQRIDYRTVNEIVEEKRQISLNYLEDVLGISQDYKG